MTNHTTNSGTKKSASLNTGNQAGGSKSGNNNTSRSGKNISQVKTGGGGNNGGRNGASGRDSIGSIRRRQLGRDEESE